MNLIIIVQQIFNYFRKEDGKRNSSWNRGWLFKSENEFSLPFYFLIPTSLIRGGAI